MLLLFFSSVVDSETRISLGWGLIYICVVYVVCNIIVSAYYSSRLLRLFIKRQFMLKKNRNQNNVTKATLNNISDDPNPKEIELSKLDQNMEPEVENNLI